MHNVRCLMRGVGRTVTGRIKLPGRAPGATGTDPTTAADRCAALKKQPSARNGCFKIWFSFVFWFLVPEQVLYSGTTPIIRSENAHVNNIFEDSKTVEKYAFYGIYSVRCSS
jgi:hypothetical protein